MFISTRRKLEIPNPGKLGFYKLFGANKVIEAMFALPFFFTCN
jgi:hypothetical protein